MFRNFTNNSPIRVLILTADTLRIKGLFEEKKNDLRNALSCYTEAIEVKCKDDNRNLLLYLGRSQIHQQLGKFRRHIRFPFYLSELKYAGNFRM